MAKVESQIVRVCIGLGGTVGFGCGLFSSTSTGFTTTTVNTSICTTIGGSIGKGTGILLDTIAKAIFPCLSETTQVIVNINDNLKETKNALQEVKATIEKARNATNEASSFGGNVNRFMTMGIGFGGTILGGIILKSIKYLDLSNEFEKGEEIELGMKYTALGISILGIAVIGWSAIRGNR